MITGNERRQSSLLFGIVLFVSLIFLSLSTSRFAEMPRSVGMRVISFVQRGVDAAGDGFSTTLRSVAELGRLRQEYETLLEELDRYQTLEGHITQLRSENQLLRDLLPFSRTGPFLTLPS